MKQKRKTDHTCIFTEPVGIYEGIERLHSFMLHVLGSKAPYLKANAKVSSFWRAELSLSWLWRPKETLRGWRTILWRQHKHRVFWIKLNWCQQNHPLNFSYFILNPVLSAEPCWAFCPRKEKRKKHKPVNGKVIWWNLLAGPGSSSVPGGLT